MKEADGQGPRITEDVVEQYMHDYEERLGICEEDWRMTKVQCRATARAQIFHDMRSVGFTHKQIEEVITIIGSVDNYETYMAGIREL